MTTTWPHTWSFADAADRRAEQFVASRAAERAYARQLRSVAERVQAVLATSQPQDAAKALDEYADALSPWATQAATNMVRMADKKNRQAFERVAARAGLDMRILLHSPGVGATTQERIAANVSLILSIVTHSREKVAEIVQESLISGTRAEALAKEIEKAGEVSAARARVIAATEVSKAGTALTKARAEEVGSEGYIWRTARDGDTRASHRVMEGRFVKWSEPPTIDNMTGHAGEFPNCRCYAEPVIPREDTAKAGVFSPTLPTAEQEQKTGEKKLLSTWERTPGSAVLALPEGESLPNADKAQGVSRKLVEYALNTENAKGKSKARVFKSALGITQEHAGLLQKQIEALMPHLPPTPDKNDAYGVRFNVRIPVTGPNGRTVDVTTSWIYDRSKDGKSLNLTPRLITALIKG